ncbi:MAG TPA: glycosyltransferase family 4 protein [Pyrinomonadaceae bacterium]|nr:glycosyltransferase family 4 protein [Pyrinomonadaceae bacterium]
MKNRPKRILMTADTVGGVWTYALELARALGKYDVEVAVATMGPEPSRAQCAEAAAIHNVDLFKSNYKLEWMQDPWADLRAAGEWLMNLEGRLRPDLVHLNGYVHAALPWRSPKIVVGHSCLFSWWRAVRNGEPPSEWTEYKALVQRGLRAADLVIAPTKAMLKALDENYPRSIKGKSLAIPNGLDAGSFAPASKTKFVFAAGRLWDEAKNVETLIGISWQLPWAVCLAGEKKNVDGDDEVVLKPNCYALGKLPRETLRHWYACASIYVLPARYEPFGLTVLEAALSGCALVLGSIDSLKENWEGAAIFVNPQDRAALKDSLQELIKNEVCRGRLGRAARERALSFSSSRMAEQYLNAYSDLLAGRRRKELAVCA